MGAYLTLPVHKAASFSIYLSDGSPSLPAFSIEYDRAQPVIKFPTSDHNSSNLNKSNLILNINAEAKNKIVAKPSHYETA